MELKKILIPTDFSDHSDQALRWGASLAEKYSALMLLLHVIPPAMEEVSTHGSASEEIIMELEAKAIRQWEAIEERRRALVERTFQRLPPS